MLFTFTFFSSNEKDSAALGVQLFSMIHSISIELWVKFHHMLMHYFAILQNSDPCSQ
jgi:hypothetical protein